VINARFGKRRRSPLGTQGEEPPAKRKHGRTSDSVKQHDKASSSRKTGSRGSSNIREDEKKTLTNDPPNDQRPTSQRASSSKYRSMRQSSPEDSEDEIMRDYLVELSESRTSGHNSTEYLPAQNLSSNGAEKQQMETESVNDQHNNSKPTEDEQDVLNHDSPLFGGSDCDSPQDTTDVGIDETLSAAPLPVAASSSTPISRLPSHRARAANPLVKLDDAFQDMKGAISVKARVLQKPPSHESAGPSRSANGNARLAMTKPGPASPRVPQKKNVSSLLTFHKGSLQTVKGRYSSSVNNQQVDEGANVIPQLSGNNHHEYMQTWGDANAEGDPDVEVVPGLVHPIEIPPVPPQPVPTGPELLQLAGLAPEVVEALPDFEDDPLVEAIDEPAEQRDQDNQVDQSNKGESLLQRR